MAPSRLSERAIEIQHKWAALTYWREIPAGQVRDGDVYANNGGSVTAVWHGPCPAREDRAWSEPVEEGFVRIECGDSFSVTTDARSLMVIGRRVPDA